MKGVRGISLPSSAASLHQTDLLSLWFAEWEENFLRQSLIHKLSDTQKGFQYLISDKPWRDEIGAILHSII